MKLIIYTYDKFDAREYKLLYNLENNECNLKMADEEIFQGENTILAKFVIGSEGKTRNEWIKLLYEISPYLKRKHYNFKNTLELMQFRSFCLIYRALGLNYKDSDYLEYVSRLNNNFYMDYTGRLGIQPHIYLINPEYWEIESDKIQELYDLQLLFKLEIYLNNNGNPEFKNYFVPFNLPITRSDEFSISYQLWARIQTEHDEVIKKYCDKA